MLIRNNDDGTTKKDQNSDLSGDEREDQDN